MISAPRLAWFQLRRRKARLAVAIAGVLFAVVLMFMQVGFRAALFRSAVSLHERLDADLILVQANYSVLVRPTTFTRRRLYQVLGFEGVQSVTPIYTAVGKWTNPATGKTRDLFVIGVDPAVETLDMPEVNAHRDVIRYPDVVLYDALSRPEFGPVAETINSGGQVATELNQRRVAVMGLFHLGTSFGIDATIITSDLNFLRLFTNRTPATISLGLIRLAPGADPRALRDRIAATLPNDVQVLTKPEYMAREVDYWSRSTPIGFVFAFGAIMGLIVGAIIVYQILFADISDHLAEYATLKAMGYTNRYLAAVVLVQALMLAVGGYLPGLGVCRVLYRITRSATKLPMQLTPERGALVLGLTIVMCTVSGLIAMRKLRGADPAEVF